jgi:hypothetical protein
MYLILGQILPQPLSLQIPKSLAVHFYLNVKHLILGIHNGPYAPISRLIPDKHCL